MNVETWPIDRPIPYARNPRKNSGAIDKVAASLKEFSWKQPIVVDKEGVVVVGHTRLLAAKKLGWTDVPVVVASDLTPAQCKAYRLSDNRSNEEAEWDEALLGLELVDLKDLDFDLSLTAFDLDEITRILDGNQESSEASGSGNAKNRTLSERFLVPPFSVLDARQGYWQERKREWLALGIKSEIGRGGGLNQADPQGQLATTATSNGETVPEGRS